MSFGVFLRLRLLRLFRRRLGRSLWFNGLSSSLSSWGVFGLRVLLGFPGAAGGGWLFLFLLPVCVLSKSVVVLCHGLLARAWSLPVWRVELGRPVVSVGLDSLFRSLLMSRFGECVECDSLFGGMVKTGLGAGFSISGCCSGAVDAGRP